MAGYEALNSRRSCKAQPQPPRWRRVIHPHCLAQCLRGQFDPVFLLPSLSFHTLLGDLLRRMGSAGKLATWLITNDMHWSMGTERLDDTSASVRALSLWEETTCASCYKKDLSHISRAKTRKAVSQNFRCCTSCHYFLPHNESSPQIGVNVFEKKGEFITSVNMVVFLCKQSFTLTVQHYFGSTSTLATRLITNGVR